MVKSNGSALSSSQKSVTTQKTSGRNVKESQTNGNLIVRYKQFGLKIDKIIGISKWKQKKKTGQIKWIINRCKKYEKETYCCWKTSLRTWKRRGKMEKGWIKPCKQNYQFDRRLSYYQCFLIIFWPIWLSF